MKFPYLCLSLLSFSACEYGPIAPSIDIGPPKTGVDAGMQSASQLGTLKLPRSASSENTALLHKPNSGR